MTRERVGFIGLGIMGLPMAGHLLSAGFPLTVFNRTRAKTDSLAAAGARVAETPAGVASESDVIITMVSDSPDVEEMIAGPRGVIQGISEGALVVDMSTVSPELERTLDQQVRERGARLLDAPVSGGDVGAQQATLAIMVGGEPEDFERVQPILQTMGKSITHCGPTGAGQVTKLCNQILVAVTLEGVCEALLFAGKNGLDPHTMIKAVSGGAAGSWQLSNLGPKIVDKDFAPGFMVDLIQKDLRIVLETAQSSEAPLPALSLVRQLFTSAQGCGHGRDGTQVLARIVDALGGGATGS